METTEKVIKHIYESLTFQWNSLECLSVLQEKAYSNKLIIYA